MMRPVASGPLSPAPNSIRRSPWLCAAMTAALAATFWLGLIWFAGRILS